MLIIRHRHIDIDGKLYDQHQEEGEGDRLKDQQDNDKNRRHREEVDSLDIDIGRLLQILHHRGFADDQGIRIPGFDDLIDLSDLGVHLRGRLGVFGDDQAHLMLIAPELVRKFLRDQFLRDQGADHGGQAQGEFHSVHVLDLCKNIPFGLPVQVPAHDDHVGRVHMKSLFQFIVGYVAEDIVRKRLRDIIVNTDIFTAIQSGSGQKGKDQDPDPVVADDKRADAPQVGNDPPVRGFFYGAVKHQDHGRQYGDAAQDTDQDTLGHDDADVPAQGEGHNTESQESGDSGDGASHNRAEGLADGDTHRLIPVLRVFPLVFLIALQQKDRIVHRDSQLKHRSQGLGDVGNGTQEKIAAQIVQNGKADPQKEEKRHNIGFRGQLQDNKAQDRRDHHVDRQLLETQILDIRDNTRHSSYKAPFIGDAAHLRQGRHSLVRGGRVVVEHDHQLGVPVDELTADVVGQDLCGDRYIHHLPVPEHTLDMVDLVELIGELLDLLHGHPFNDAHGKGSGPELIHHQVLPSDRLQRIRQVTEQVIVDPCPDDPDHRGDQKQCAGEQDKNPHFRNPFTKFQFDTSFIVSVYYFCADLVSFQIIMNF